MPPPNVNDPERGALTPYREPTDLPTADLDVPDEFVYLAGGNARRNAALRKMAGFLWLGGLGAVTLLLIVPEIGRFALPAYLVFVLWQWRRGRKPQRIVLTARKGQLSIAFASHVEEVDLRWLTHVELQTRAVERVHADKMVGATVISMGVLPAIDVSRIALRVAKPTEGDRDEFAERTVLLGDDFEPYSQAAEWMGKLRVFLRKHGWVPEDERDAC